MTTTALRLLTNSEQKTHRRCSREHHISYELGIRSAQHDAPALRFGTVIHKALEQWWRAAPELRLTYALASLPLELEPYELARATEMLRGYDIRWRGEPLEPIAIEAEFRCALVNPATGAASRTFELAGKLDALVLNLADGKVYIVEHKTSSDNLTPGSDYWAALRLDTQVSTYYAGARALGYEPSGVIYDVLGKCKLRPLAATPLDKRRYTKDGRPYAQQRETDESPDEYGLRVRDAIADAPDRYFVRGTVVRLEQEEKDAAWDTWQTARNIRDDEVTKRWPRNPDACRRFGRLCSYFEHCTGTASLDDPHLFRRVERVHEELEQQPTTQPMPEAGNVTH